MEWGKTVKSVKSYEESQDYVLVDNCVRCSERDLSVILHGILRTLKYEYRPSMSPSFDGLFTEDEIFGISMYINQRDSNKYITLTDLYNLYEFKNKKKRTNISGGIQFSKNLLDLIQSLYQELNNDKTVELIKSNKVDNICNDENMTDIVKLIKSKLVNNNSTYEEQLVINIVRYLEEGANIGFNVLKSLIKYLNTYYNSLESSEKDSLLARFIVELECISTLIFEHIDFIRDGLSNSMFSLPNEKYLKQTLNSYLNSILLLKVELKQGTNGNMLHHQFTLLTPDSIRVVPNYNIYIENIIKVLTYCDKVYDLEAILNVFASVFEELQSKLELLHNVNKCSTRYDNKQIMLDIVTSMYSEIFSPQSKYMLSMVNLQGES